MTDRDPDYGHDCDPGCACFDVTGEEDVEMAPRLDGAIEPESARAPEGSSSAATSLIEARWGAGHGGAGGDLPAGQQGASPAPQPANSSLLQIRYLSIRQALIDGGSLDGTAANLHPSAVEALADLDALVPLVKRPTTYDQEEPWLTTSLDASERSLPLTPTDASARTSPCSAPTTTSDYLIEYGPLTVSDMEALAHRAQAFVSAHKSRSLLYRHPTLREREQFDLLREAIESLVRNRRV